MVKWIIQKNLSKPDVLNEFRAAFLKLGIAYEEVEVIPFSKQLPAFEPATDHIFYGSTTMMLNAFAEPRFKNGVFYNAETFTSESYLANWTNRMLNADGEILTFQKFVEHRVDKKSEWFIRPNDDDKSFAGSVLSNVVIKEWFDKIKGVDSPWLNPATKVFVGEVKSIQKEWRNFIVDRQVIESTRYVAQGLLNISKEDVPTEMIEFSNESAKEFSPHDIFVMDVALTSKGYKIVEANCFNGTGFYNHNIMKIIRSITKRVEFTNSL